MEQVQHTFSERVLSDMSSSGNHYSRVQRSNEGLIRIVQGISPVSFDWLLGPGKQFETPEAVMVWSGCGFSGMTSNMHRFVNEHIIPSYWKGRERPVREAKTFGATMLQMNPYRPVARNMGLNIPWAENEDCYFLNVWAPRHDDGKKRPVFVWMHGGGFFAGSSIMEVENMEGFNMAQKGDIVFVSMNHRLNVLGHLNLADYGEEFENSKNLGIADLVAALKWVHENIEAFGGDPDNVTIAGHSGGGGKVLSMYQIEEAKDLFSRGIVMSGVLDDGPETTEEESRILARTMMDHLGITKENIDKVFEVPFSDLVGAYRAAQKVLNPKGINTGLAPLKNEYFRGFPISDGFCEWSKDKPLMLATTLSEFNFKVHIPVDETQVPAEHEHAAGVARAAGKGRHRVLREARSKDSGGSQSS